MLWLLGRPAFPLARRQPRKRFGSTPSATTQVPLIESDCVLCKSTEGSQKVGESRRPWPCLVREFRFLGLHLRGSMLICRRMLCITPWDETFGKGLQMSRIHTVSDRCWVSFRPSVYSQSAIHSLRAVRERERERERVSE